MKKEVIATLIVCFCSIGAVFSQDPLAASLQGSATRLIYKLHAEDIRKIHRKDHGLDESLLHTQVGRFKVGERMPELPRGNYMIVGAEGNRLHFTEHIVDDLLFDLVPDKRVLLLLYDSLGNTIGDARVRGRGGDIPFDDRTQTYAMGKLRDGAIIEVAHAGVYHFIAFERESDRRYSLTDRWRNMKYRVRYGWRRWLPGERAYGGFMVFSKPRYKPDERVRWKAYVTDGKGRPYKGAVDVRLRNHASRLDTVLTRLEPYLPGLYAHDFPLSDSLKLRLDQRHQLVLQSNDARKRHLISGQFRYEEYELKSLRFAMESERSTYTYGDSITFTLKATDENGMAVYDGRAEIVVVPEGAINRFKFSGAESVFLPDTLWRLQVDMGGFAEKEIALPDSIFPCGISTEFEVIATYRTAANEKAEARKIITFEPVDHRIAFSAKHGLLDIEEWHKGAPRAVRAQLVVEGKEGGILYRDSVNLPHRMPLHWAGARYVVRTANGEGAYEVGREENVLSPHSYRDGDSVVFRVDNPSGVPFWYRIRRGKRDIAHGRATALHMAKRDTKGAAYHLYLGYILGDEAMSQAQELPYSRKNIELEVETPAMVYPGQRSDVMATVSDRNGRPVAGADITAYAYTTKFDSDKPPVTVYGKVRYAKPMASEAYALDASQVTDRKIPLDRATWREPLRLDTILYYDFLYPQDHYLYSRPAPGGVTQLSPYVVIDGRVEGVHLLWIDGVLRYARQAQQMDNYVFDLDSGVHTVRMRTADRDVVVSKLPIDSGRHTILSVNASAPRAAQEASRIPNAQVTVLGRRKERLLSDAEIGQVTGRTFTMDTHFGQLRLPGAGGDIDLPAYLRVGSGYYYLNPERQARYDAQLGGYRYASRLFGPVAPGVYPLEVDTAVINHVSVEGGHHHTVFRGYQRLRKWEKPQIGSTLAPYSIDRVDFSRFLLTKADIRDRFDFNLQGHLAHRSGEAVVRHSAMDWGKMARLDLRQGVDQRDVARRPKLVLVTYARGQQLLYYGGSRSFRDLPIGEASLTLVYGDRTGYTLPIALKPGGLHLIDITDLYERAGPDSLASQAYRLLYGNLRKVFAEGPIETEARKRDNDRYQTRPAAAVGSFDAANQAAGAITGTVRDAAGQAIQGVWVALDGVTARVTTDGHGRFEIREGRPGKLLFSALGYEPVTVEWREGFDYDVVLHEASQELDEVVVVGFGTQKRSMMTASVSHELAGRLPGLTLADNASGLGSIWIRGTSTVNADSQPLIVINGLPYAGKLEDLDQGLITSLQVLKGESATAVYGSRAANGVIFIETKGQAAVQPTHDGEAELAMQDMGNSLRRDFHDDAFWQPRLQTDAQGKAAFELTYPDDITSWNANFIAVGKRKQTDAKQMIVRALKSLSARLAAPRFALRGDSLAAVGKLANHLPDTVSVIRTIAIDGHTPDEQAVSLVKSHTDRIPVSVALGDSLAIAYSLRRSTGFMDGEELRVPIFEPGLKVAEGAFVILGDTVSRTFRMDPSLGGVTVHAETSGLDVLLREVETLQRYPYSCNEQLASKLKALLAKKAAMDALGRPFDDDRKIERLLAQLQRHANAQGGWGWWGTASTVHWITVHVAEALLAAERAGFAVGWQRKSLAELAERELRNLLDRLPLSAGNHPLAKRSALDRLLLLKALGAPVDYRQYHRAIASLPDLAVRDRLRGMELAIAAGERAAASLDTLLSLSRKTLLGNRYWGEEPAESGPQRMGWLPDANDVENTLRAYGLLQALNAPESALREVQHYFFEQRKNSAWQNTYAASRVLEALLPTMLRDNGRFEPVNLRLNGQSIAEFPHTETLAAGDVQVDKTGTFPVFFTAYQEAWLPRPARAAKGFAVRSGFGGRADSVAVLKAGTTVDLTVTVTLEADADYVLVEVPIPAGCSYESKDGNVRWETYREYEKEKVVICCERLPKGEHRFIVKLAPRFGGRYTLNPAKAELMYFPTFHGHETIKQVMIESH